MQRNLILRFKEIVKTSWSLCRFPATLAPIHSIHLKKSIQHQSFLDIWPGQSPLLLDQSGSPMSWEMVLVVRVVLVVLVHSALQSLSAPESKPWASALQPHNGPVSVDIPTHCLPAHSFIGCVRQSLTGGKLGPMWKATVAQKYNSIPLGPALPRPAPPRPAPPRPAPPRPAPPRPAPPPPPFPKKKQHLFVSHHLYPPPPHKN